MNNTTFKAGDKVYFPRQDGNIYTLVSTDSKEYPLFIDQVSTSFTMCGKFSTRDENPSIFHVTDENSVLLSKLYNTQFEKPKKVLKGSDLTRHLISEGKWAVCYVSDHSDENAIDCLLVSLIMYVDDNGNFMESDDTLWNYAVPIQIIDSINKPLEMEV